MSAQEIIQQLQNKEYKPVYWLEGEEPYYIDKVIEYAEHSILNESEAGFNLHVFYGKDSDRGTIVNACMRYPMFSEKQVVIIKEAQHLKDVDMLESYINNPMPSTILVVGYKDKKLDGRSKLSKIIKQKHIYLLSEKLKEYKMDVWIRQMLDEHTLSITPMALTMLIDHIGTDLSRMENEIKKLSLNLQKRKQINENDIEQFVGISKEFNVFELQNALGRKDLSKAIRIIQYFSANPKAAPIQLILPSLYSFFSKLYLMTDIHDKSEWAIASLFNKNGFAAKEAIKAYNIYGSGGIEKVLMLLHHYNLRSVGVGDIGTSESQLLKEMAVKITSLP